MYKLKPKEDRGQSLTDWSKSLHSFSFAQYFDPYSMGFSDLRVINDNIVLPQNGYKFHTHSNMEIINIVLLGKLDYKDTTGKVIRLNRGQIQVISAGTGIMHSELNNSEKNFLHFLQIWILPKKKNVDPKTTVKEFGKKDVHNKLCLVVSENGTGGSLPINQDVNIYQCVLDSQSVVTYPLKDNRKLWIQVANGAIDINGNILESGDGISIVNETGELEICGVDLESDFMIFDLRQLKI